MEGHLRSICGVDESPPPKCALCAPGPHQNQPRLRIAWQPVRITPQIGVVELNGYDVARAALMRASVQPAAAAVGVPHNIPNVLRPTHCNKIQSSPPRRTPSLSQRTKYDLKRTLLSEHFKIPESSSNSAQLDKATSQQSPATSQAATGSPINTNRSETPGAVGASARKRALVRTPRRPVFFRLAPSWVALEAAEAPRCRCSSRSGSGSDSSGHRPSSTDPQRANSNRNPPNRMTAIFSLPIQRGTKAVPRRYGLQRLAVAAPLFAITTASCLSVALRRAVGCGHPLGWTLHEELLITLWVSLLPLLLLILRMVVHCFFIRKLQTLQGTAAAKPTFPPPQPNPQTPSPPQTPNPPHPKHKTPACAPSWCAATSASGVHSSGPSQTPSSCPQSSRRSPYLAPAARACGSACGRSCGRGKPGGS